MATTKTATKKATTRTSTRSPARAATAKAKSTKAAPAKVTKAPAKAKTAKAPAKKAAKAPAAKKATARKSATTGVTPAALAPLSPSRVAQLTASAGAFGGKVREFPGHIEQRLTRLTALAQAARRDAADLVRTPFHGEPALTTQEIEGLAEQVAFLRWAVSNHRSFKGSREQASERFDQLAPVARQHIRVLLAALDVRYRQDPTGRGRVSAIRAGEGDADLVQDVSDTLRECQPHQAYLAGCPRGESASLAWLRQHQDDLAQLHASKGPSESSADARRLRDVAFSLAAQTERRLRAAASYWYEGTPRFDPYAAFVAPSKGGKDGGEGGAG